MYEKIVQEYRIWLEEALEVLHVLCEDVVPAGRVGEEIYLESKILYRNAKSQKTEEVEAALFRYALRGKALLHPVRIAVETVEEDGVIQLRRTHAGAILSSLQMLANYACLAETCKPEERSEDAVFAELGRLFEIDTYDEVKRIRSGVQVVCEVQSEEIARKIRVFRTQEDKVRVWNSSAAG